MLTLMLIISCAQQGATVISDEEGTCAQHTDCENSDGYWCIEGTCSYSPDFTPGVTWEDAQEEWSSPTGLGAGGETDEIGGEIDVWCDVSAYQNGPDYNAVHNWSGDYGLEWQCTEFAFRFLCQAHGLCDGYDPSSQNNYGNARYWFANDYGNTVLAQLSAIPNNSTAQPQPGDVLTFNYGTYGHVAIIKEVDLEASVVEVIEQNCYGCSHQHVLYRSGDQYSISGAQGWLRADGELSCTATTSGCEGDLLTVSASGTTLTVTGTIACQEDIEKWSLVLDETTIYSEWPAEPDADFSVEIDAAEHGFSTGSHTLGLWVAESGSDAELQDSATIELASDGGCDALSTSPAIGDWTADFTPVTNCSGACDSEDCYTLYRGAISAVSGNEATLSFTKANNGGGPSTDVTYWIVVSEDEPTCSDRELYTARTSGTWSSDDDILTVSGVNIWPSEESLESATAGEEKRLFIITGGSGYEDQRIWYQAESLRFTKTTCAI